MASQQDKFFYSYFISPAFTDKPKNEKINEIKERIGFLEIAVGSVTFGTLESKEAAQKKIDYLNALLAEIEPQAGGRKARKARKTRKHSRKVRKTRKH
jgi:hypothetical protein